MNFHMKQSVYLIEDFQKVTIIKYLGNLNYIVNTQSNKHIQVSHSQITDDKDLVIQTLLSKYSELNKKFIQLNEDYNNSRDAWWRLKDEIIHYKKLLQKTNINSFKHL
jgi:hypothetical protein